MTMEKIKNLKPRTRQLTSVIGLCISLLPTLPLGKLG